MNPEPYLLKTLLKFLEKELSEDSAEQVISTYRQLLLADRRRKRLLKYICRADMPGATLPISVSLLLGIFNTYFARKDDDKANLTLREWSQLQWNLTVCNNDIRLDSSRDVHRRTHAIEFLQFNRGYGWMLIKYTGPQRWKQQTDVCLGHTVRDVEDPLGVLEHTRFRVSL